MSRHEELESIIDRPPTDRPRTTVHQVLLATSVLQALVLISQSAFAGSFLAGSDAAVSFHEKGGWVAFVLALLQVLLLLTSMGRRYGLWLMMSSLGIVLAEALQLGTGYGHFLQVHIPLAVLVVGGITWQIVWIVRHR